jgi:hypothetical protein
MTAGEKMPMITVSTTPGTNRETITPRDSPVNAAITPKSKHAAPRLASSIYAPVTNPFTFPRDREQCGYETAFCLLF